MKVMWVCNNPVSIANQSIYNKKEDGPSWIEGLLSAYNGQSDFILAYCFPQSKSRELIKVEIDNILFYGFYREKRKKPHNYSNTDESYFNRIINEFQPDILHIFGTEFSHTLAAVKAFKHPNKTLVSIQGLCYYYTKHYYADLPSRIINRFTFRDLIKLDNIRLQARKFLKRGINEIKALQNVSHITGRTDFDRACCLEINPDAQYHFCNEILRDSFYNMSWDINNCEKYTIFFSQCYYPIKGLHFMIEALAEIKKTQPKVHLFVSSIDITKMDSLRSRLSITSYGKYINELIKKYNLTSNITFLGKLDENEMCKRFLKSHVFVSTSSIENSPNSVGEAMMLGVPIVCSDAGGVKDLLTHNQDGFVYQYDAPYMLAYYVKKIFEDDKLAISLSKTAVCHANVTYNREVNLNKLKSIYQSILLSPI